MQINVHVDKTCVIELERLKLRPLIRRFRILDPNRVFDPQFRAGKWNGYYQFVDLKGRFRVGLLSVVLATLKKLGYVPNIRLHPRYKHESLHFDKHLHNQGFDLDGKFTRLRAVQKQALVKMRHKLIGSLNIPTSGGKSEIIFDYVKSHPDARCLYIVTRSLLCAQTAKRGEEYIGEDVGSLSGVIRRNLDARFVCAVDKSMANAISKGTFDADSFDVIFVDECHKVTAKILRSITYFFNWRRAFGFTGSYPTEKKNLVKHWHVKQVIGSPIFEIAERKFNEGNAFIPKIAVLMLQNEVTINPCSKFAMIYTDLKNDYSRNDLIATCASKVKRGVLIIVNHAAHGIVILKMCQRKFKSVKFISAKSARTVCQQAFKDLDSGELGCLISTPIIDEGISINNIRVFINAAGWKSEIVLLQRVGRGKRTKTAGDNKLLVIDFMDNGHKVCRKNALERFSTYKRITKDVRDKQNYAQALELLK